jgi:hypothetical protein
MYADMTTSSNPAAPSGHVTPDHERPAIEVIEMANGETVWYVNSISHPMHPGG